MAKWVYMFTEGNATMRNLLGGKGANLAEMTNLGLPVPQGFTVTTEACTQYYEDGRQINDEIMGQIMEAIDKMEGITGKKFGDKKNPLLVSVRSGARASMPGMMDTILNLGLNEEVVETLAEASGNPRWAWDCYRRFIQMFSDVVMEVGKKYFEELIDKMKADRGVKQDVELTAEDLKELANQFKAEYKEKIGSDFPSDPKEQLMEAVKAAQCEDIIKKFPDGIETVIGAKGVYLSGGEMQRIAIAGAILKDSPIIVLDEATAFADPENEYKIQRALEVLTKNKTVVMIAHRLSTIKNADQIIVLKDGEIAERGKHNILVEKKGIYAEMWKNYQTSVKWDIKKGSEKDV